MIKNKPDFKLINFTLIVLAIFLLYQTGNLWIGVVNKLLSIIKPFFIAFVIAYALHPTVKWLQKKGVPKILSIIIVVGVILSVFVLVAILVGPLLIQQSTSLFNSILAFLKDISADYDINIGSIQTTLTDTFNSIISSLGKYVSDGAINAISVSLSVISIALISFSSMIYFLSGMDSIRSEIRDYFRHKSKKTYNYFKTIDHEMKSYLNGYVKIVLITFFEYSIAFTIIGHPNAMLLGLLATVGTLIPYFGGIFTNIIAAITAFVISPALFIRTVITFIILSSIDGYVINPTVYGKTNKVHPLIVIASVFAGGLLFGITGIIISLPSAIIILATYKYYKEDISDKLEDIKENKKSEQIVK